MDDQEKYAYALSLIERFRDGHGIDWSNVESVFDVVEPMLRAKVEPKERNDGV